jgi:hypothetical protein
VNQRERFIRERSKERGKRKVGRESWRARESRKAEGTKGEEQQKHKLHGQGVADLRCGQQHSRHLSLEVAQELEWWWK